MGEAKHETRAVFTATLALNTPEERARYLDEACQGKPELRQRVEALLRAHEQASSFLEEPAAPTPRKTIVFSPPLTEKPGDKIGHYKLLEEIGEGAFGQVFMAEQTEPVYRKVALKIIKAGMDTREVIARFEAERQALALMDHPKIAKVLDAGATGTGRPYFVMELVRGIPITAYCEQQQLSTAGRLQLFLKVCHAVQHAHQKGIIHRDLKPTNILVTLIDGEPVPKVIDFGIAKALGQKLTEKTLFTAFQQMIGTPAYMSPEQAALSGVDVDTRSDIYSLGVLLYELLTGVTPFDQETLRKAAMDEICRFIRETEPPRPSTRLTELARSQKSEVRSQKWKEVRGDLDWIVMKCLEKDRARRYETANSLADDIERHLKLEPVNAAAPSALYRTRKFVRRHKAGLATVAALALLLVAGVVVSTWEAIRATRAKATAIAEKQRADKEAATANRITEYMQQMLYSANPEATKDLDYSVRQLLDDFSGTLESRLADQPEVEAALHATIGNAYWGLQEYDKARHHLTRALELRRALFGTQHEKYADSLVDYAVAISQNPGAAAEAERDLHQALAIYRARRVEGRPVIHALWALQYFLVTQQRHKEIEPVVREALAEAGKSPGAQYWELAAINHGLIKAKIAEGRFAEAESIARDTLATDIRLYGTEYIQTAWAHELLTEALLPQGRFKEAMAEAKVSLAIMRKRVSPDNVWFGYPLNMVLGTLIGARSSHALAEVCASPDELSELEPLFRPRLSAKPRAPGNFFDPVNVAARGRVEFPSFYAELGNELSAAGRPQAAQECQQKASALFTNLLTELAQDSQQVGTLAQSLANLAWVLHEQGKLAEAETLFRQALAMQRKLLGEEHREVAWSLNNLTWVLHDQGKLAEAETVCRQALAMRRKLLGEEHPEVAQSLADLAVLIRDERRLAEAETMCRAALAMRRKLLGEEHRDVAQSLSDLAGVLLDESKLAEAETVSRQALAMRRKLLGEEHRDVAQSLTDLANVLHGQYKLAEAETLFRQALAMRRKLLGEEHPEVARSLAQLAFVLREEGRLTEAETVSRQALTMRRKLFGEEHPEVAQSLADLAWVLEFQGKLAEAETVCRQALAMRTNLLGDEHPEVAQSLGHLALVLRDESRLAEAETMLRQALVMRRKLFGEEHLEVSWSLTDLAWVLHDEGKLAEAETVCRQALAIKRKLLGEKHQFVVWALADLARVLVDEGRLAEAVALFREGAEGGNPEAMNELAWFLATSADPNMQDGSNAVRVAEKAVAATGRRNPGYLDTLAAAYAVAGQFTNAIRVQQEAIALLQDEEQKKDYASRLRLYESGLPYRDHYALAKRTQALLEAGKFAEAEPLARECLAIREKQIPEAWRAFNARSMLGASLLGQKKYAEAEPLLLSGYEGMKQRENQIPPIGKPRLKEALQRLVQLYDATGHTDKAAEWKQKLAEFEKTESGK